LKPSLNKETGSAGPAGTRLPHALQSDAQKPIIMEL
jgi:hypothetical protein